MIKWKGNQWGNLGEHSETSGIVRSLPGVFRESSGTLPASLAKCFYYRTTNFNEKKTLKTTAGAFDSLFEVEDKGFANEAESFDGIAADEDRASDADLEALEREVA